MLLLACGVPFTVHATAVYVPVALAEHAADPPTETFVGQEMKSDATLDGGGVETITDAILLATALPVLSVPIA